MAEYSSLVRLQINTGTSGSPTWKKISDETELTQTINKDTIETSSKDTGDWKAFQAGLLSGTVSVSANVAYVPASGFVSAEDMFGYIAEGASNANKGVRQFKIADPTVGSSDYAFSAVITSHEQTAPNADVIRLTLQLQITGAITVTAVTA
jgi:predicted secreted protein